MMSEEQTIVVTPALAGQTLAAALRAEASISWSAAKRLIMGRRVEVNGALCLNDARRLKAGERVRVLGEAGRPVPREADVRLLHIDADIVVVDKPAGIITLRRDEEQGFLPERKELQPSLDELIARLLTGPGRARANKARQRLQAVYAVHRLDRDTSGLMVFALSPRAREALIGQFSRHEVRRTYWAAALGRIEGPRRIESWLVRDRGDGLRGSGWAQAAKARQAITQLRPVEAIGSSYTILECSLETGRTHQIRIHLAEMGHMLCGEKLYLRPRAGGEAVEDGSGAPRQALHSASLELLHPVTGLGLRFESPLPADLARWLAAKRAGQSMP